MRRSHEEVIGLFNISRVGNDVQLDLPAIYPDSMARITAEPAQIVKFTRLRAGFGLKSSNHGQVLAEVERSQNTRLDASF